MKKIVYLCDNCSKVLSDNPIAIPHLSIDFGHQSGWVAPHSTYGGWSHTSRVKGGVGHFCSGKCLGNYFNKLKKKNVMK